MDVKVTKSLLMTALITGSVLWGGALTYLLQRVWANLSWIKLWLLRQELRNVMWMFLQAQ